MYMNRIKSDEKYVSSYVNLLHHDFLNSIFQM